MKKIKSRRRGKRTGKLLWLIAGIMAAIALGIAVYMLISDSSESAETDSVEIPSVYPSVPFDSKEEKGYDLPASDSEQKEAEDDCKKMMGLISELYKNADKGCASNVVIADEVMYRMVEKLKGTGYPVTITAEYFNMENYKVLEDFLNASMAGGSCSAVVYKIHSDGGIGRHKFSYDGKDMYVLFAKAGWSDDNRPVITYISYTRIKEWKYTDKGWFCYELCVPEYPEVTNVRKNDDGTVTLTVDAVCSMFLCNDTVITHELKVRFAKDGSFKYLGNKILGDGISNIPKYQYRTAGINSCSSLQFNRNACSLKNILYQNSVAKRVLLAVQKIA